MALLNKKELVMEQFHPVNTYLSQLSPFLLLVGTRVIQRLWIFIYNSNIYQCFALKMGKE
jgi:hypothetical protein